MFFKSPYRKASKKIAIELSKFYFEISKLKLSGEEVVSSLTQALTNVPYIDLYKAKNIVKNSIENFKYSNEKYIDLKLVAFLTSLSISRKPENISKKNKDDIYKGINEGMPEDILIPIKTNNTEEKPT